MEVLLLYVAELLIYAIAGWAILAVQVAVLGLELCGLLLNCLLSRWLDKTSTSKTSKSKTSTRSEPKPAVETHSSEPEPTSVLPGKTQPAVAMESKSIPGTVGIGRSGWFRKLTYWSSVISCVLLAVTLLAIFIANLFFFEPIVRRQLAKIEQKTGIGIEFKSAAGSLWQGRVELSDTTVKRGKHEISQLDLTADKLTFDVSVLSLFQAVAIVEEVSVDGLRGTYERVGVPKKFKPKKPFKTELLVVTDAVVTLIDHTRKEDLQRKTEANPQAEPITAVVEIKSLKSEPFRSNFAVFDLMFRSNLEGVFAGAPISIVTDRGSETLWKFERLPIEMAAGYVGGPLDWVSHGELDISGIDRWQGADSEVEMDFKIVLHDVQAVVPPDTSLLAKVVAVPTVALLNRYPKRLPLSFYLKLDEKDFEFTASPLSSRLGRDIGRSINEQVIEKMEDKKDGLKDKLKGLLRFGKGKEEAPGDDE